MSIRSKKSFQGKEKMKYNDLQAKILQYLYIHPEGVTGAKMASHCGVSLNTIRREFTKIYDLPGEESFEVISRPSVGYQILVKDETAAKHFFQQLNKKMNNPLFDNNDPKTYKVNAIIRRLLVSGYYINLIQLTEMFNYSESSLRRDLKEVEQLLSQYDLVLKQKKGYGFYIEGDEINKRLCLLGQHKLFVNLTDEEKKSEQEFINVFGLHHLQIKEETEKARRKLQEYDNLSYKLIDVRNVTNYLPLIHSRNKFAHELKMEDRKVERLEHSGLIPIAEDILSTCIDGYEYDTWEVMAFAGILQGYRSAGNMAQLTEVEQQHLENNAEKLLAALDEVLEVSDAMCEDDLGEFLCDFYNVQNRMIFSILQDKETYRKLRHTNIFTEDMCRRIKFWIEDHFEMKMQTELELAFYYVLDRLYQKKTHRKDHLKLVLISTYGTSYGKFCRDVLLKEYEPYIDSIEVLEFTQIHQLKEMEFDYLLTDIRIEMIDPALREKVCFLETQDNVRKGCKALWDIINERRNQQLEILRTNAAEPIRNMDITTLQEHPKMKYKGLVVYSCRSSEFAPGIYTYEPEKPFLYNGKKVKKAAVVCYHNRAFIEAGLMEEELLKNRK